MYIKQLVIEKEKKSEFFFTDLVMKKPGSGKALGLIRIRNTGQCRYLFGTGRYFLQKSFQKIAEEVILNMANSFNKTLLKKIGIFFVSKYCYSSTLLFSLRLQELEASSSSQ